MSDHQWQIGDYFYSPWIPEGGMDGLPWYEGSFPIVGQVIKINTDDKWVCARTIVCSRPAYKNAYYYPMELIHYASTTDLAEAMMHAHILTGEPILLGELTP